MPKYILCLLFVLCAPTLVMARTTWEGDSSTDFFDAGYWDNGLPHDGAGTKMTRAGANPTYQPTLENGSVTTLWYEVTHGVEFTIGTNGVFNVLGTSDSSSMAQAAGSTGTINLVDNGRIVSPSSYNAWEGDAFINMSGTSSWFSDVPGQPWTLGHWDDSPPPRTGVATMIMSDDSMLTVTSGNFRIPDPGYSSLLHYQEFFNSERQFQGYS